MGIIGMIELLDLQSIEWTPAACFIAFQASLVVLTGCLLTLGLTNGYYKMEPHTKKISSGRRWELVWGSHLLLWGAGMIGGLIAGGAHVTCILMLPPMLGCTYYHYAAGSMGSAVGNCVFMVPLAYFGFVPWPTVQSIEWTPAAIFLACHSALTFLAALPFLLGTTDGYYESNPHIKKIFYDDYDQGLLEVDSNTKTNYKRYCEIGLGSQLLGSACCVTAAVIAGGAQDMCLLQLPPLIVTSYVHYTGEGGAARSTAIFTWIIMVALAGFGLLR